MKKIIALFSIFLTTTVSAGVFQETNVPTGVFHLSCDGSPRIVVTFAGGVNSIWYPANGTFSQEFLSVALAAKTSSSGMYYYGGDDTTSSYCVHPGNNSRQVSLFGLDSR